MNKMHIQDIKINNNLPSKKYDNLEQYLLENYIINYKLQGLNMQLWTDIFQKIVINIQNMLKMIITENDKNRQINKKFPHKYSVHDLPNQFFDNDSQQLYVTCCQNQRFKSDFQQYLQLYSQMYPFDNKEQPLIDEYFALQDQITSQKDPLQYNYSSMLHQWDIFFADKDRINICPVFDQLLENGQLKLFRQQLTNMTLIYQTQFDIQNQQFQSFCDYTKLMGQTRKKEKNKAKSTQQQEKKNKEQDEEDKWAQTFEILQQQNPSAVEFPDYQEPTAQIRLYKFQEQDKITYFLLFTGLISRIKELDDNICIYIYHFISKLGKLVQLKTKDKFKWLNSSQIKDFNLGKLQTELFNKTDLKTKIEKTLMLQGVPNKKDIEKLCKCYDNLQLINCNENHRKRVFQVFLSRINQINQLFNFN